MKTPIAILVLSASLLSLPAGAEPVRVLSETGNSELVSALESELRDDASADTVFEARRQARRGAEQAENYLNSRGYFAPEISYSVDPGPPPSALLRMEPGPAFKLASVAVDLGDATLSDEAVSALDEVRTLAFGDAALPSAILAEEAGLLAALKASGYANATVLERAVLGDRDAGTLDLTYRLDPGPRIRLGAVIYPDDTRTRRAYLDRLIPYEEGTLFAPRTLSAFTRRLNATRLYRFASVDISDTPSRVLENGDQVRDV